MTRMIGPDYAVMCNLINTQHTNTHTKFDQELSSTPTVMNYYSLASTENPGSSRAVSTYCLKKNLNVSRPFEYPPVRGEKMSRRLGGIIGCKDKTFSWHLNGFPDGSNIGSTL